MKTKYQDQYEKLGVNIMLLRRDAKMTQEELSEKVGITKNHVSKIELGKGSPSLDVLFALAEYFKIPVTQLFEYRK